MLQCSVNKSISIFQSIYIIKPMCIINIKYVINDMVSNSWNTLIKTNYVKGDYSHE